MHSHHTLLEAAKGRATGRSKTPCRVTVGWAISCSTAVRTTLGAARRLGQQHDGSLCAAALLLALLQCNQSPMQSISNAVSNAISNATVVNRCSCSRARRAHDTLMSARAWRDGASSGQASTPARAPVLPVSTETKQPAGGTTAGCYASVFMYEELAAAAQPPLANFGDVAGRPGRPSHSRTQPPATGARHCQTNVTTLGRLRPVPRASVDEKAENSTISFSIFPPGERI